MKELTREEWLKNPTPRVMWVWDNNENCKHQAKVIYFAEQDIAYPVITLADNDKDKEVCRYKHCAEVPKKRRMTNKELSRWLRLNPTREYKYITSVCIYNTHSYADTDQDIEVSSYINIRENDGDWKEPLVEEE